MRRVHDLPPTVVVGLGNEIAGDDGVGLHIASELERRLGGRPDVEVVPLAWAGLELLGTLEGRRRAAVVDCLVSGRSAPGTVVRLSEDDFRGSVRLVSFHDADFRTVLGLGRRIGLRLPEEIAIWAVEGERMDTFEEGLTPQVEAASRRVVEEVLAYVGPAPTEPHPHVPGGTS